MNELLTMTHEELKQNAICGNFHVTISKSNRKTETDSVSLLPIVTCRDDVPCKLICYAGGMISFRDNVFASYLKNTYIALYNPDLFFSEIEEYVLKNEPWFFRIHVSGDIPNAEYFRKMILTITKTPKTRYLIYTKQYEIVNDYRRFWLLPENLSLIFSNCYGWKCDNPFNFPTTNIVDCAEDITPNQFQCGGHCAFCQDAKTGCWFTDPEKEIASVRHGRGPSKAMLTRLEQIIDDLKNDSIEF